jgi:hypothetical protein
MCGKSYGALLFVISDWLNFYGQSDHYSNIYHLPSKKQSYRLAEGLTFGKRV